MSIIEEKNRGYALGAADYLVKPVDRGARPNRIGLVWQQTERNGHLIAQDDQAREPGVRCIIDVETRVDDGALLDPVLD